MQGGSFGLINDVYGARKALQDKIMGEAGDASFSDLMDKYRSEANDYQDRARQQNPGSYLSGEIPASVATSFIPGLNVAKGASMTAKIGRAAAQGGLTGVGYSEGSGADRIEDGVTGAGIGSGIEASMGPLGKVANMVRRMFPGMPDSQTNALTAKLAAKLRSKDEAAFKEVLSDQTGRRAAREMGPDKVRQTAVDLSEAISVLPNKPTKIGNAIVTPKGGEVSARSVLSAMTDWDPKTLKKLEERVGTSKVGADEVLKQLGSSAAEVQQAQKYLRALSTSGFEIAGHSVSGAVNPATLGTMAVVSPGLYLNLLDTVTDPKLLEALKKGKAMADTVTNRYPAVATKLYLHGKSMQDEE
jgi:hypothetical protein